MSKYTRNAIEVLREVREKILFDTGDDGQPNSTIRELFDMWGKVNDLLEEHTFETPEQIAEHLKALGFTDDHNDPHIISLFLNEEYLIFFYTDTGYLDSGKFFLAGSGGIETPLNATPENIHEFIKFFEK